MNHVLYYYKYYIEYYITIHNQYLLKYSFDIMQLIN